MTLRLLSSMISNTNHEINFPHKLLLFTHWKVSMLGHAFVTSLSANIKLCKSWLSKLTQLGGFPGKLPKLLLKTGLSIMKNIFEPLAKSVLISLGLTAVSAADMQIHKKFSIPDLTILAFW